MLHCPPRGLHLPSTPPLSSPLPPFIPLFIRSWYCPSSLSICGHYFVSLIISLIDRGWANTKRNTCPSQNHWPHIVPSLMLASLEFVQRLHLLSNHISNLPTSCMPTLSFSPFFQITLILKSPRSRTVCSRNHILATLKTILSRTTRTWIGFFESRNREVQGAWGLAFELMLGRWWRLVMSRGRWELWGLTSSGQENAWKLNKWPDLRSWDCGIAIGQLSRLILWMVSRYYILPEEFCDVAWSITKWNWPACLVGHNQASQASHLCMYYLKHPNARIFILCLTENEKELASIASDFSPLGNFEIFGIGETTRTTVLNNEVAQDLDRCI